MLCVTPGIHMIWGGRLEPGGCWKAPQMVLNTPVLKQLNSSLRIQHVINYGGGKNKKISREFQAGEYNFSQKAAVGRFALECLLPD